MAMLARMKITKNIYLILLPWGIVHFEMNFWYVLAYLMARASKM